MRESVRLVLSQQLAGIRFTIWTLKSESVVKSTDVVEFTNVVEPIDVLRRLSSRTLLSLQTREIRLERRAEPAGTREVRLQTSWTCWNERGSSRLAWSLVVTWEVADDTELIGGDTRDRLTTQKFDRWLGEIVALSLPVHLPGELWVKSTVGSSGSSSTESPADVTDDRPPEGHFRGV